MIDVRLYKASLCNSLYRTSNSITMEDLTDPLKSIDALAMYLGTSPETLKAFFHDTIKGKYYSTFYIDKDTGKIVPNFMVGNLRKIDAPQGTLKEWQRRLVALFNLCDKHPSNYAYMEGRNTVDAVTALSTGDALIHIDLKDFFPHHNYKYVADKLKQLFPSISDLCLSIITDIVCKDGVLPQGSPCSPILSVVLNHDMDVKIENIANKYNLVYTRYADDLCFSGNISNKDAWEFLEELANIVHPFTINRKKVGIMRDRAYPILKGVTITSNKLGMCSTHIARILQTIKPLLSANFTVKKTECNYRTINLDFHIDTKSKVNKDDLNNIEEMLRSMYPKHEIKLTPRYFYIKSIKQALGLHIDDTGVHYPRKKYTELRRVALLIGIQDAFHEYLKLPDSDTLSTKDIIEVIAAAHPNGCKQNWRNLYKAPLSIKSFMGCVSYLSSVSPDKAEKILAIRRNTKNRWREILKRKFTSLNYTSIIFN